MFTFRHRFYAVMQIISEINFCTLRTERVIAINMVNEIYTAGVALPPTLLPLNQLVLYEPLTPEDVIIFPDATCSTVDWGIAK